MFKNFKTKNKLQKGFTIIEVMIVLAIAGLILVVVLVAIPQLQRNQRNNARQSIAARITTEVSNFAGNNNGTIPLANTNDTAGNFGSATTQNNSFVGRYLSDVNIDDPSTGDTVVFATPATGAATNTVEQGEVEYRTGAQCGIDGAADSGTNRSFTIRMGLEGGITYCLDNQ